jgi:hypothetical protein
LADGDLTAAQNGKRMAMHRTGRQMKSLAMNENERTGVGIITAVTEGG